MQQRVKGNTCSTAEDIRISDLLQGYHIMFSQGYLSRAYIWQHEICPVLKFDDNPNLIKPVTQLVFFVITLTLCQRTKF